MPITRILVANRGEIARRVFRTCRAMGIGTVAVYARPDANEPHVREADSAIELAGADATSAYLDISQIVDAAVRSGADAVHPGYGFLSENAGFARAVVGAGLAWIGPPPEAVEIMGSKIASKRLMRDSGVPTIESRELEGKQPASELAAEIGYPVLVKASAGGGGKGMRVVDRQSDLDSAIESARREAASAFGDDTVFLEQYLPQPRHIEIQVFGDTHGRIVSLFERECSIQRRHQKIVEESPSPVMGPELRDRMGKAAVAAAAAVGYIGAGTVEFLVQGVDFFFLEMNTRLQVEHPVTEMVTGLDLVRLQIEIADGGPLPDQALDAHIDGHAIECRLYAEDPANDFLPAVGTIHDFTFEPMPGLRIDSGVEAGSKVSIDFDPMLAKVIAHAPTRDGAASILAAALRTARIHGGATNRALLVRILESEDFRRGETDTRFLERHDPVAWSEPLLDAAAERAAAISVVLSDRAWRRAAAGVQGTVPPGWRNLPGLAQRLVLRGPRGDHVIEYSGPGDLVTLWSSEDLEIVQASPDAVEMTLDGRAHAFAVARYGDRRYCDSSEGGVAFDVMPRFPRPDAEAAAGSLRAPMPGRVLRVEVGAGEEVASGDPLVVLEAMKMEHTLRSPHGGVVVEVLCRAGDQVEGQSILVVVDETPSTPG
jgi:acetyl/propionyl-CoA carboxylase alpha subunit